MTAQSLSNKELLLIRGVRMPCPESVVIGEDIDADRISGENVAIHAGCRVNGPKTFIASGAVLGREGPATVENCYIGPDVSLNAGYFKDACFLAGASAGSGAHVREGTIFEEQASIAHTVGLKQTILFPFVTLGSLINFCDCFMSGGTDGKNHSEVGSSFIHFNYTPNQDKATPTLLGDVPRGVMLNQPPIFLGGQGGLVGPCRLAFGTVTAAGTIYRKDELRPGRLIYEGRQRGGNIAHTPGFYRSISRIVENNIIYLSNLMALLQWYKNIRKYFVGESFPGELHTGLVRTLKANIGERLKQFKAFSMNMPESAERYRAIVRKENARVIKQKYELFLMWPEIEAAFESQLENTGDPSVKEAFYTAVQNAIAQIGNNYIDVIKSLDDEDAGAGIRWLDTIVASNVQQIIDLLPSFGNDYSWCGDDY